MTTEHSYIVPYLEDTEIIFTIINQGEPSTNDYPGCKPEIEIKNIEKFGVTVSDLVFENQIGLFGKDWEEEIITTLEARNGIH